MEDLSFRFKAKLSIEPGKGAWSFITMPKDASDKIKFFSNPFRKGFGSVRVTATIGNTVWNTSVFPSKVADAYLLPVKAEIRKKNNLKNGDVIDVHIRTSV